MCSTVQEQITTCGQNAIVKIGERTNIRPQKRIHKRSTTWEPSVKKIQEGLNMSDGTNLTLISDVGQEKYMFGSHERSLAH